MIGAGAGSSLASFLRFWAVAAKRNSSRAPFGPRSRNRSSLRMRLRCANSISTFFRSRHESILTKDDAPGIGVDFDRTANGAGVDRISVVVEAHEASLR